MIHNNNFYPPQYAQELPTWKVEATNVLKRVRSIASAALPLLNFHPATRTPLAVGLSGLRSIVHLQGLIEGIQQRNFLKSAVASGRLLLSLTAVALLITALVSPYFSLSTGLLVASADDVLKNILDIVKALRTDDKQKLLESIARLVSTLVYIAFIASGQIELLTACMLLQIAFGLYLAAVEFRKGHFIEGGCYLATSLLTLQQVIPQVQVVEWKWRTHPSLEGELCRNDRGFIYVKVKDEIVFELNKLFGDSSLPPYFGPGKYGAHITTVHAGELNNELFLPEIGKKISFQIASCNSLTPENFKGVNRVSFLTLSAPELDAFRVKYGLTPKVNGSHDFHITFGVNYDPVSKGD